MSRVVMYVASALSFSIFWLGWGLRLRKYRRGRRTSPGAPPQRPPLAKRLLAVASNATVIRRNRSVGAAHLLVFWGIVGIFLAHIVVAVDLNFYPFFTRLVARAVSVFLVGRLSMVYAVVFNTAGLLIIVGAAYLMVRRACSSGPRLDYSRAQKPPEGYSRAGLIAGDWVFVSLLFANPLIGLFMYGLEIRADGFPPSEKWQWVAWLLAHAVRAVGIGPGKALQIHEIAMWVHIAIGLTFVAYIPFSKAMHIFTSGVDLVVADPGSARRLPPPQPGSEHVGYLTLADLTRKELLGLDACTRCGRCHEVCPARAGGAPLSPRDFVLDLRQWADAVGGSPMLLDRELRPGGSGPAAGRAAREIAGDVIAQETLWACTTCMACVEVCPVGIEHVPTIVQLRRRLVDTGRMEPSLQLALQNVGQLGNSFGKPSRERTRWTKDLGFEIKDARKEPVSHLWFVGDFASFDTQVQALSRTLARILHDAGVDFGLLYHDEWNAGNDVRRVGEESLFEHLVEHNLDAFGRAAFDRIFTTDPHSFNTLRNEYPEHGLDKPVLHYTELLAELLESGAIAVRPLGKRVTYHDPCYLGRYNGVTEAPRRILAAIGCELVEMPRNRENSFCCGAGGGRFSMTDSYTQERPSENRIREAAALDVQTFAVACPKDYVMYSDAVKTTGHSDRLVVSDVVQLLDEARVAG
ncbi:MAG: 4Fe-4S dicluster domain-containing protein [Actinobacteria bacterium]|nr:4Fe-4S dicluster domain-containing protein [Actinomycetota bacterium]